MTQPDSPAPAQTGVPPGTYRASFGVTKMKGMVGATVRVTIDAVGAQG